MTPKRKLQRLLSAHRKEEHMKSLKHAVTIIALIAGSFRGAANAAQVIVFEQPLNTWNQEVFAEFAVNRELSRAWIDVQIQDTDYLGEGLPSTEVIMRMLDGLYYDSARKQLLYRTGTESVVCAEDANFLWTTYLKSTGNCLLTSSTEQRKIDDGFNVHEQTVAKVTFDARASSAGRQATASPR
jgi:hypothetical protein